MFVLSVLEAPNTKTNSLVCANTLGNKALSDSDSDSECHSRSYSWNVSLKSADLSAESSI